MMKLKLLVKRHCERCGCQYILYHEFLDKESEFIGNYPKGNCPQCGKSGFDAKIVLERV